MKHTTNRRAQLGLATILVMSIPSRAQATAAPDVSTAFEGEKTSWHGFDRYDLLMDQKDLTLKPIKAATNEGNGVKGEVKGQWRCVVVVPKESAPGKPWSWQGCYWDHEPQTEVELLKRGFHIAFVMADPGRAWDAWYQFLTEKHGLSKKPAFIGMSRGGVNEYIWATANPDKVSCIYADNPAIRPESLQKIGELARNDVPLLQICGSLDFLLQQHALAVENVYHQLGGRITMMIKEGAAHHPHSLRDPRPIADWIVKSVETGSDTAPAYVGKRYTKSYYYSNDDSYTFFPKENTYVTCRGPLFTECYDRYDVRTDSTWGITAMTVVVPKTAAAGRPWVFRAERIGRNTEVIDLALLAKGFHIVAAPVTAQSGPVREQWESVYKLLTDNGFSRKPVMEGAGTAAGEAYAWAIENPEKVSCIYGENPALRSLMSKKSPIDHLAPLAKAGVPLIHVCGSLDPWLERETRVVEKRYKELGGPITVIIKEGEGHFPLAPKDPKAVVDLITKLSKVRTALQGLRENLQ
jgi:pimeloyl-ACP methyl ester carboxylesterase